MKLTGVLSDPNHLVDHPHVVVLAHKRLTTEVVDWLIAQGVADPPLHWQSTLYTPDPNLAHQTLLAIMMDDPNRAFEFKMRFG